MHLRTVTRPRATSAVLSAILFCALGLVLCTASASVAQSLDEFNSRTTVHVLKNGWTFIIVERPVAPVFSFATQADVGAAQDPKGQTGIAHMMEHMAFKGTPNIGTTDYVKEKPAIEAMEAAYQAYEQARADARRRPGIPPTDAQKQKIDQLLKAFKEKEEAAAAFVKKNEFDELVTREGGVGLNAGTASDSTTYFYSLPANKFELFAYLESERFWHPVFREFYKERDVVVEERRMRTESSPIGRLVEKFTQGSFVAHPYHEPPIGQRSDLDHLSITDAQAFFDRYYAPANLVTAIVGGIKASEVIPIIDKYFDRVPPRPQPEPLRTVEPAQIAEVTLTLKDPSQPFYIEGYHKPAGTSRDEPAYDALSDILTRGNTSRMYRSLVRDKKIAVSVQGGSGFPGNKYPNLWIVYGVPARGVGNDAVRDAIRDELKKIQTDEVTDEELQRFKTRAKADLLRSLNSNSGLAEQLVVYQTLFGDWKEMFQYLDRVDKVSKADIKRVAADLFKDNNRTVGRVETTSGASKPTSE
jgi:predicted Zn-dependent peptidase